jgi:branched-chain amino acid transport system permease protein
MTFTLIFQVLVNGLVLGGLYACIAAGFSLVWGVLNVINILHGTFVVIGSYCAYYAYVYLGIHPFISVVPAGAILFIIGYLFQRGVINRVVAAPVLITLSLTFGLDLFLNNSLLLAFSADYLKLNLANPLGVFHFAGIFLPIDRLAAMVLALLLTFFLYWVLETSRIGRAIVAVRMDREAASLMGVNARHIYAITFGLGALMAGMAGAMLSVIYPISPIASTLYLSTISFSLLILLMIFRPTGIMGKRGYE